GIDRQESERGVCKIARARKFSERNNGEPDEGCSEDRRARGAKALSILLVSAETFIQLGVRRHTSGESGRVPGEPLFFTAHLSEARTQQFFLSVLLDHEILQRCEVNEP